MCLQLLGCFLLSLGLTNQLLQGAGGSGEWQSTTAQGNWPALPPAPVPPESELMEDLLWAVASVKQLT